MGTVNSRNKSFKNMAAAASEIQIIVTSSNDSDDEDEFVDCSSEFFSNTNEGENFNLDSCRITKISNCDEIEKNSKPLESDAHSTNSENNNENDIGSRRIKRDSLEDNDISNDADDESGDERKERQRKELEEFREEINRKRELRQQCIKNLREELNDLRERLATESMNNEQLRELMEQRGSDKSIESLVDENKRLKIELAECQLFLQTSNSENINATLENQALHDHVRSLKEVIKATKEMLKIRELQVDQLKSKLTEIEASFAEKETKIMSESLKKEYERQLENIRSMRELYEERANLITQERNQLKQQLDDKEHDLKTEIEKYV
jgi:chromosome segregation ATPase